VIRWLTMDAISLGTSLLAKSNAAAERQAVAAEKQAAVTPDQLAAAQKAADAAHAQAKVALETAEDAKRQSSLVEVELKSSLRPILSLRRDLVNAQWQRFTVVNEGEGAALEVRWRYGHEPEANRRADSTIVAAKCVAEIQLEYGQVQGSGMVLVCNSSDGREFVTEIKITPDGRLVSTHHP
jgi:hypothetical protein